MQIIYDEFSLSKILLSHSRALDMGGRVKKSSEGMLCPCPPDCCPEVEEDESYTWLLFKVHHHLLPLVLQKFLLKVLYGQWIVMGSLVLPIIARQAKASQYHISKLKPLSWCNR